MNLFQSVYTLFNPEIYHGWNKENRFFEGWYFRVTDPQAAHALAIIPGVSIDDKGNRRCYIELIEGPEGTSTLLEFPFENFRADRRKFYLSLDGCSFSDHHLSLHLDSISGRLEFEGRVPGPKFPYPLGLRPLALLPPSGNHHLSIVSMNHYLRGSLRLGSQKVPFDHGVGYIEKYWGSALPALYLGMQSHHFDRPNVSFKLSITKMHEHPRWPLQFWAGLWLGSELHLLAPSSGYTLVEAGSTPSGTRVVLQSSRHTLAVTLQNQPSDTTTPMHHWATPAGGAQSLGGTLEVEFRQRTGAKAIFEGLGRLVSLQRVGNINQALA